MTKRYPRLYKDTMTTDEVIKAIPTINNKMGAKKWLERNRISFYKTHEKSGLWDRKEVFNVLGD